MRKDVAMDTRLEVRLTQDEKAAIKIAAANRGLSVSDFIRNLVE